VRQVGVLIGVKEAILWAVVRQLSDQTIIISSLNTRHAKMPQTLPSSSYNDVKIVPRHYNW